MRARRTLLLALAVGACAKTTGRETANATRIPPVAMIATPEVEPEDAGTRAPDVSPIVDLAIGHARGCAVRADGRVVCWGRWPSGEQPAWPREATLVPGLADAVEIAGDDTFWCARRKSGEVVCWSVYGAARPVGVANAVQLGDMCALLAGGSVKCWGGESAPPISGAVALSRGNGATCVVEADRSVACWGENTYRQVGDGTTTPRTTPFIVPGVAGADEVASQYFFGTCARAGGVVTCWGGERGAPAATAVPGITDAVQLAVSEYFACVRRANGTIACWGDNSSRQLGVDNDAATTSSWTAVPVPDVQDAIDVALGGGEPCGGCGTTCVVRRSGDVLCWGEMVSRDGRRITLDLAPGASAAP